MTKQSGLVAYQRRVAEEKRTSVLDAAVNVFIQSGYSGATLEQIARAAGVSTGTLFKHFPTKAALFGAIMTRVWEAEANTIAQLPEATAVSDGLRQIGLDYARLLRRPHVEGLFRVIVAETPRFPELGQELYERGKKPYLDRLNEYLEMQKQAGRVRIEDVPLAARQFLGMINDVIFWPRFLIVDLQISEAEVEHVVQQAVMTFASRYLADKA